MNTGGAVDGMTVQGAQVGGNGGGVTKIKETDSCLSGIHGALMKGVSDEFAYIGFYFTKN